MKFDESIEQKRIIYIAKDDLRKEISAILGNTCVNEVSIKKLIKALCPSCTGNQKMQRVRLLQARRP